MKMAPGVQGWATCHFSWHNELLDGPNFHRCSRWGWGGAQTAFPNILKCTAALASIFNLLYSCFWSSSMRRLVIFISMVWWMRSVTSFSLGICLRLTLWTGVALPYSTVITLQWKKGGKNREQGGVASQRANWRSWQCFHGHLAPLVSQHVFGSGSQLRLVWSETQTC